MPADLVGAVRPGVRVKLAPPDLDDDRPATSRGDAATQLDGVMSHHVPVTIQADRGRGSSRRGCLRSGPRDCRDRRGCTRDARCDHDCRGGQQR